MKAQLSINGNSFNIEVSASVLKEPELKLALKDWRASVTELMSSENEDSIKILIPLDNLKDYEVDNLHKDIKEVFEDLGIAIEQENDVTGTLGTIEQNEKNFLRDCEAARSVWDGNIDVPQFKDFSRIVKEKVSTKEFPDGLYKKQLLASYHLAASGSACNFSVPGAGKTLNVWAAFAYLNSLPENHPKHINSIFVLGPNACFEPWESEFSKCFERKCKSVRFLPSISLVEKRKILKGITQADNELYLCHFQTFSLYPNDFLELFKRAEKKIMLVVDEAHNIKGQDGKWSNAALAMAPYARSRIILTGTPAPNGYEDLKNLFDFIHPNRDVIGFSRSALKLMSENKLPAKELAKRVRPFYIRIKKGDLNIPPADFKELAVPMSTIQEKVYGEIESKFINGQTTKLFKNANLIRLRQAASNPLMLLKPIAKELLGGEVDDDSANRIEEVAEYLKDFDAHKDLPKLSSLMGLAAESEAKNEKIIIWSYFVGNIELIYSHLTKFLSCPIHVVTGSVPMGESDDNELFNLDAEDELNRGQILKAFREANGASILIATPQCIGESISLHMECHKAIYYDRDFNCGLFIQSKDRIHRKGLPADTITEYIFLSSKYTVDEVIQERLRIKEERMLKLIESEEIPLMTENFNNEKEDDIKSVLDAYYAK